MMLDAWNEYSEGGYIARPSAIRMVCIWTRWRRSWASPNLRRSGFAYGPYRLVGLRLAEVEQKGMLDGGGVTAQVRPLSAIPSSCRWGNPAIRKSMVNSLNQNLHGVYARRAFGRHHDHRHLDLAVVAGGAGGPGGGTTDAMLQQSQTVGLGDGRLRERQPGRIPSACSTARRGPVDRLVTGTHAAPTASTAGRASSLRSGPTWSKRTSTSSTISTTPSTGQEPPGVDCRRAGLLLSQRPARHGYRGTRDRAATT